MTSRPAPQNMRKFLAIWAGQVISLIGSGLTSFGLAVWIFQRTGAATPFALTALFSTLPRIVLAPVAGVVADRWNRRLIMILADTGSALVTLTALLLMLSGQFAIEHIYLIALAGAVCGAFQEPAYTASITQLVPAAHLGRANGLVQLSQALEMLAAPIIAGALFPLIGLAGLITIDLLTFGAAVGALLLIPVPQPAAAPRSERNGARQFAHDLAFGFRYLAARPGLLGLLLFAALANFLLNGATVLTGPLVLTFSTPAVLGLMQSVLGLGMLAGSVVISAWGGPRRRVAGSLSFVALMAVGLALVGVWPSPWTVGAGLALMVFCAPVASGCNQAIFQAKVAPEVQGRVFAVRSMIARSMLPLATLLAGPLADQVFEPLLQPGGAWAATGLGALLGTGPGRGMGLMFVLAGVLLLAATALAALNPRLRAVETDLPDAAPAAAPAPEVRPAPAAGIAPATSP
ncbi:MAG: MFS transporter [Anaerolineales bacterium]|nr:MFS transporter [Anaerolineales bacterium]